MHIRLVTQPYGFSTNLRDFVRSALATTAHTHFDVVVAWARATGLNLVADDLADFRSRGGRARIILGISQGGATRQGLKAAMDLFDEAYVFHRPGRTFHPKLYVATGDGCARVLIGSQNMTVGGAVLNDELATDLVVANLDDAGDAEFVTQVVGYVDGLLGQRDNCKRLTPELLVDLLADPRYLIGDEEERCRGSEDSCLDPIFGNSVEALRGMPARKNQGPGADAVVVRRWFKSDLRRADVQRLGGTNNPSGHLTLVKAGHPIDKTSFFRDEFFVSAPWHPVSGSAGREQAEVAVEVYDRTNDVGTFILTVDSHPAYESDQGNRTATLRWGPDLGRYLRIERDHVGDTATIEAMSDGTYRLTFDDGPTGDFL